MKGWGFYESNDQRHVMPTINTAIFLTHVCVEVFFGGGGLPPEIFTNVNSFQAILLAFYCCVVVFLGGGEPPREVFTNDNNFTSPLSSSNRNIIQFLNHYQ